MAARYPKHPPLLMLRSVEKGFQALRVAVRFNDMDHSDPKFPSGELAAFCRKNKLHFARSRVLVGSYEIAAHDPKQQVLFKLNYNCVPPLKADLDKAVLKIQAYFRKR